jgi:adenosylhomocysteine nucleosidase
MTNGRVTIGLVGARAAHLQEARAEHPSLLILAGLAGALSPDLKVGDVVIDGDFPPLAGVRAGKLATADHIVATPAEKAALFKQTGALAVDMETDLCRHFAQTLHVPFLAVRGISDAAHQGLDPALLSLLDDDGRVRMGRLLQHLAGDPRRLASLIQLGLASKLALSHLSTILIQILESGWPQHPPQRT